MIFTSDQAFFDRIGENETKRYFDECYKFICNYKNLGEKNIVSAVVHLDEGAPHLHLMFIPVVHTKDKEGNAIEKICSRDFWKGRDSYRKLQDAYFNHVKSKGFDLERGMFVEDTGRQHYTIEQYKKITNYENTKKVLSEIKVEIPELPNISDISKLTMKRDEKILEQIIKPKDELIEELHHNNVELHKELSKQANVVEEAQKYQQERNQILLDNQIMHNRMQELEVEYKRKKRNLDYEYDDLKKKLENEYYNKVDKIEYFYRSEIHELKKENKLLRKTIDKFKVTVSRFINWVCRKFDLPSEDEVVREFEKETHTCLDAEKQLAMEKQREEKSWELER